MGKRRSRLYEDGPRRWGVLTVVFSLLLGTGTLVALALYERDANLNFKLQLIFGTVWIIIAIIRAFQLGQRW